MAKEKTKMDGHVCCRCGSLLPTTSFYKTISDTFGGIGHLPICKTCLNDLYKKYKIQYMNPVRAIWRICMTFDLYFDERIAQSCTNNDQAVIGDYYKKLNLGQCRGKTFDTNIEEGVFERAEQAVEIPDDIPPEIPAQIIDPQLVEKWGEGLQYIDYLELEKHYKYLKSANPNGDNNQEIFIIDLCYTKMQQMKAVREGRVDDYNKLTESYRKSFQQAGLKTVRDPNMTEGFLLGVNAETIEKYTPAEYYKNKALYKDYDGIGDYIDRFMLRPLRNLMHGTTDRDTEFYVKDEAESDEYSDDE